MHKWLKRVYALCWNIGNIALVTEAELLAAVTIPILLHHWNSCLILKSPFIQLLFTMGITSSFEKTTPLFESSASIPYHTQFLNQYTHTELKQIQEKEKRKKWGLFSLRGISSPMWCPEIKDKDMDQNNILKMTAHNKNLHWYAVYRNVQISIKNMRC